MSHSDAIVVLAWVSGYRGAAETEEVGGADLREAAGKVIEPPTSIVYIDID